MPKNKEELSEEESANLRKKLDFLRETEKHRFRKDLYCLLTLYLAGFLVAGSLIAGFDYMTPIATAYWAAWWTALPLVAWVVVTIFFGLRLLAHYLRLNYERKKLGRH